MNETKWKYINGHENQLKIYEDGTVWSMITNNYLPIQISKTNGRSKVFAHVNKTTKLFYIDDLIAEHFLKKDSDDQLLNHIDKNLQNNHITNLKYMDTLNGKKYKYIDGFNKKLIVIEDGSVFNLSTSTKTITQLTKTNHNRVCLLTEKNGKNRKFYVDELVATHFLGKSPNHNFLLVHIDGNSKNDDISNLKYSDYSEQESVNYATKIQPIFQFDLDYNFMRKWDSVEDILKSNPTYSYGSIRGNIYGDNKNAYNYLWKYDRGLTKPVIIIIGMSDLEVIIH